MLTQLYFFKFMQSFLQVGLIGALHEKVVATFVAFVPKSCGRMVCHFPRITFRVTC
jgi:hypothetical protein